VVKGMELLDGLFKGYGERPNQEVIERQGNDYLKKNFPKLDYVLSARVSK
jgi:hypothetical protein